jgi:hypothetical protein
MASTLLLFEEFVPAEYRNSLINQGNKPNIRKRLRLAGLLGSKKSSKPWKQAATLNGKPYSIGNVPRGPSPREAEFERLIQGNASATKVLSLNSSVTVGHDGVAEGLRIQTPAQEPKTSISSFRDGLSPLTPSTIASPSQAPQATSTPAKVGQTPESRAKSPFNAASLRRPRLRFPVGRENKSFIPSEYETVDFDTRLASYSDDELNGRSSAEGSKAGPAGARSKLATKDKRMSKDDAWVDILVSGRNRMGDQDAEMPQRVKTNSTSRGLSILGASAAGRSDPELASMEVEKALAGVRQMSPTLDDHVPQDGSIVGEDDASRTDHGPSIDIEDGDSEVSEVLRNLPKKKIGYFDLHPDRKPANYTEPRRSNVSGYEDSVQDRSLHSEEQPSIEQYRQPDGDIEVPAFIDGSPPRPSRSAVPAPLQAAAMPTASSQTQSKTANLIEMYRERERQTSATPPASAQPSRIPTRSSSLPASTDEVTANAAKLAANVTDSTKPTQIPQDESPDSGSIEDEEDDLEPVPPFAGMGEMGRASPLRYVHGAPLHNVLEEGEEEEVEE